MNKSLIILGTTSFLLFGSIFMSTPTSNVDEKQTQSTIRTGVYTSDGTKLDHMPWKSLLNDYHSLENNKEPASLPRSDVYLPDGTNAEQLPWTNLNLVK
ncbi:MULTISPECIES: hypothetical protein [Paenibacillus]|uniref:hypothetical protein n=1 Tax=Paenibacillus TaxID=44249 RepID=UPI0013D2826D|nr:hypothetical protein [Paenibacillus sp. ALJ109b]NEU60355.1 hypothetical protein [Paenibacillus sp. ALJ109b]